MKTYKDLDVYQEAMELVTTIYTISKKFPKDEIYGLTNQMCRSAVSIPSNIAEGASRKSTKEYIQFLYISLGSNAELDTQLAISKNLGYINETQFISLSEKTERIGKMLNGIIKYLKNQQPTTNNQQRKTKNQQPTTNNQQPTTKNEKPTTNNEKRKTNNE